MSPIIYWDEKKPNGPTLQITDWLFPAPYNQASGQGTSRVEHRFKPSENRVEAKLLF
jgi:hypothetical protein